MSNMKSSRIRVLYVDDNQATRYIVSRILKHEGYAVQEAGTGRECLQLSLETPDIIILDVNLPDISGLEVCARIKDNPITSSIPILHLSADYIGQDDQAYGLELGADGYLIHPVNPVILVATVKALIRSKHIEKKFRESEFRFRYLADSIPHIVMITDSEANIEYFNRRWYKYTGLPEGHLSYPDCLSVVHPDDVQKNGNDFLRTLAKEGPFEIEVRLRRHDGEFRWHLIRTIPFPTDNSSPGMSKHFGTATDIDDQKRSFDKIVMWRGMAEENLENMKVERALREQFVFSLSHDLLTPLTVAKMSAQIMGKKLNDDSFRSQFPTFLEGIIKGLNRLENMIKSLLDAHQIHAGERISLQIEELEMNTLIQESLLELVTLHGNRFSFKRGPRELDKGYWSKSGITRILENLVNNAVKYGRADTPILIGLNEYKHGSEAFLQLTVNNQGSILTVDEQTNLFRLFQRGFSVQTDGNKRGWGIGLTLVRGIAEAHGGKVQMESALGTGTTFTVTLPMDCRSKV